MINIRDNLIQDGCHSHLTLEQDRNGYLQMLSNTGMCLAHTVSQEVVLDVISMICSNCISQRTPIRCVDSLESPNVEPF